MRTHELSTLIDDYEREAVLAAETGEHVMAAWWRTAALALRERLPHRVFGPDLDTSRNRLVRSPVAETSKQEPHFAKTGRSSSAALDWR